MNISDVWLPPPDLTITEWADLYRKISPEASAEPGKWITDRAPYQRGMMDAISDERYERIIMMTSAQIGKTEIILNTLGYYIDKEPSPILLINPTLEMGESFSKDRLAPMIRDTECLRGKIKDPRTRDSGNTLLHKKFPGGHITIAGANSPAGLASRPIRILLCDEVDRYPFSAGTEGDPLSLAMKRTANFWNRKIVIVSTPTIIGISPIEKEYQQSTKDEWQLPCPECGYYQAIKWEKILYKEKTEPVMICENCGKEFPEHEWKKDQLKGKWVSGNSSSSIKGFHVNAFASPWVHWNELCQSYEEAVNKGPEAVKVWVNTVLGLPYEDKSGTLDFDSAANRKERYEAEIPDDVLLLTAGVDTQDNRLECEIVGWGLKNQSWGIYYKVIYGRPDFTEVWDELDKLLSRTYYYADGTGIKIACACIDSGGHYTDEVYKFCKGKIRRNIFAIKGIGTFGHIGVSKPSRNNRYKIPLFMLGVNTIKGVLYGRLQSERKDAGGYCHFPSNAERGYDEKYFRGLLSERMIIKRERGQEKVAWEPRYKDIRNEPLDCRVYAMGAYEILNPNMEKRAEQRGMKIMREDPPEKAIKPALKKKKKVTFLNSGFRL